MLKFFCKPLLAFALILQTAGFLSVSESDVNDAASAILHAGTTAPKVAALHHVPSIGAFVVDSSRVSPLSGFGNELIGLDIYAQRNAAGVASLRHALAANPVTRQALAANGLSVGKILGVQIGSTGSLRVFTH